MIRLENVSKRHRESVALDSVTVDIRPGLVTALLGPNGAGKSTLMRVVMGLDRADSGTALIDGRPYPALAQPMSVVGAHLGGRPWHPGRSARSHLLSVARAASIPASRVDTVLALSGLTPSATRRVGQYSLGMGQRLGLATALLGDPGVVLLDEPVNGLDTDGVRWIRELLRNLARQGRTVFLSSHLLSEVHLVADRVVVLGRGRLLADTTTEELARRSVRSVLHTTGPHCVDRLTRFLDNASVRSTTREEITEITVELPPHPVGRAAFAAGLPVLRLEQQSSLESGYTDLVDGHLDHVAQVQR
ncbi:MAG: ATP-binding cassette domain-containing protein [Corynebacteriales bacterium]|nr:ATP-binding cassette domain-containing protein [Mycobacteriales bacterium]